MIGTRCTQWVNNGKTNKMHGEVDKGLFTSILSFANETQKMREKVDRGA